MKANAITRIVIYSVVILLLVGVLVVCLCADSFFAITNSGSDTITDHTATVPASEVESLSIEWAAGTITIKTADTPNITVTESGNYSEKYTMVCTQRGTDLEIQYAKSSLTVGIGSVPAKDLVITVPENWNVNEIELDGAALEVHVSGIAVANLNLDGAAMELTFNGQLNELDVDGAACELNMVCVNKPAAMEIDGASCELDLTLPSDCGYLVQTDGLGCSFDADTEYTLQGDRDYVYGDRHCKINVDGLACQIKLRTGSAAETLPTVPCEEEGC